MCYEPDLFQSDNVIIGVVNKGDDILKRLSSCYANFSSAPSPVSPEYLRDFLPGGKVVRKKPGKRTILEITDYSFDASVHINPVKQRYCEIWEPYGITISPTQLYKQSGFHQSNYSSARTGRRKVSPGQMIAACLLSNIEVQAAFDAFHECSEVLDLPAYGFEASVLAYCLNEKYPFLPGDNKYDFLVECTERANNLAGLDTIPQWHKRNKKWQNIYERLKRDKIIVE